MRTSHCGTVRLLALALASMALVAIPELALAQQKTAEHSSHDDVLRSCAKACSDCQRECDSCATHCAALLAGGKKEHMTTLMSCQDCATVCAAAAQIVSRGGPFAALICDACAKSCDQCAQACEKFPDDKHMKTCAEECRKCEKACKAMVQHVAAKEGREITLLSKWLPRLMADRAA